MTENERMSISGLLDVLNTGIALSTCHMEYAIQSNVLEDLIGCLEELEQYRAIGTIEEFKALKEKNETLKALYDNARKEGNNLLERARNKAIDEAIETVAKAICIGCGYLDGHECTYKGGNCTVSKPMLETVVRALEQMKEGGENE